VHIWDVWNKRDYTGYADYSPRFVSEFGFQGPATWSTIARAIHDEPLSSNSPGMLLHQKADDGNGKLDRGMAPHLPAPHTFEDWHYLTQLNQSRAIVYAIERFRSMRGHCMGTIVWQLNDCWPVSSWAAIDGDGRRKPLWHGLRKANSDRLLSFQRDDRGHLELVAINDSREPWTGDVSVSRRRFDGSAVTTVTTRLDVPGLSRNSIPLLADLSMPDVPSREVVVGTTSGATTAVQFFLEDLHLDFGDPGLTVEVGEWNSGVQTLRLAAGSLARSVCLFVDRIHPEAWVDRAAVDVIPGAPETFTIHTPVPIGREEITSPTVLRSVNDVTVKQVLAV
jgi:beta-mannosidase